MTKIAELSRVIQSNKYAVEQKNLWALKIASGIGAGIQFLLFMVTYLVPAIVKNRDLYGTMTAIFAVIFVGANFGCKRYRQLIMPGAYLLLTAVFTLAIILGTVLTPNGFAVTFCVLFFALPQLFIDKIIRLEIFQALIAMIFCILTFMIKPIDIASIDAVNVTSFWVIAIPLNYSVIKMKLNDIDHQRRITWKNERDGLTQIYNKDTSEQLIKEHMMLSKGTSALMVMDIDCFKGINDTFGHQAGDSAIKVVSQCISGSMRRYDVVGRFGGDEFVVYMMEAGSREVAMRKAEQIRNKVQLATETGDIEQEMQISISIGIAFYPEDSEDYNTLFEKADKALYLAKSKGKNQVECYSDI